MGIEFGFTPTQLQLWAVAHRHGVGTTVLPSVGPALLQRWPGNTRSGNIRELQNLIERAALLSTGPSLRVPLAEILTDSDFSAASGGNALERAEREQIVRALRESIWVVGGARGAAARLGLKRTSLAYKMQKFGISTDVSGAQGGDYGPDGTYAMASAGHTSRVVPK